MTNQSELEHVMGQCKCDSFMSCWYWHTVKRIAETTDKTSLRDIVLMREQYDYITANYTPNSEVRQMESEIAWLDGKIKELRGELPCPLCGANPVTVNCNGGGCSE